MSYDIYFRTVIGYIMDKSDALKVTKVRSCSHDIDTTKKFCSECGEPVWVEEEVDLLENAETLNFEVFDYGVEYEQKYAVGIGSESFSPTDFYSSHISFDDIPENLSEYRRELQEELKALGIEVSLDNFAIHTVVMGG